MRQTVPQGYGCSQCGDNTASLGGGLPRLKPMARAEDFPEEINRSHGLTLRQIGFSPCLLAQDMLDMNKYLFSFQFRYGEGTGYVLNCVTTLLCHGTDEDLSLLTDFTTTPTIF